MEHPAYNKKQANWIRRILLRKYIKKTRYKMKDRGSINVRGRQEIRSEQLLVDFNEKEDTGT
jgi:hypothetical protein